MFSSIVIGIIQGSVYGMLAIGIVLIYKGARVFNFAQAEFGTAAAFFLMWFTRMHLNYYLAFLLAMVAIGAVGWLMERLVIQPLFNAPRVTLLVATAGVALLAIALELKLGGTEIHQLPRLIDGNAFSLFGTGVSWQQLIAVGVLGGLALGLGYFFSQTDLGLAVLATSQEPVATELVGIGTRRISSFIWVFAAVLGGLAGLLQAPDTTFTAGFMTVNFLLLSFTAAVVGGITSLSGAFVGGLAVGVFEALSAFVDVNYVKEAGIQIPGFSSLIIFILLVTVLVVRPQGLLGTES